MVLGWLSDPRGPPSQTRRAPGLTAQAETDTAQPPSLSGSAPGWWGGRECAGSCSSRAAISATSLRVTWKTRGPRAGERSACQSVPVRESTPTPRVREGHCRVPILQVGAQGTHTHLTQNLSLGGPSGGIELLFHTHTQVALIPAWPQVSTLPMQGRLTWYSAAEKEADKSRGHRRQEWAFSENLFHLGISGHTDRSAASVPGRRPGKRW